LVIRRGRRSPHLLDLIMLLLNLRDLQGIGMMKDRRNEFFRDIDRNQRVGNTGVRALETAKNTLRTLECFRTWVVEQISHQ
jgi:hypothetical protein